MQRPFHPSARALSAAWALIVIGLLLAGTASAQYFGRNKVMYENFDFRVMESEHFDLYFYPPDNPMAPDAALMAERWYARLAKVFDHRFVDRKPIILYANHADFQQTNVSEGFISEGTGGFTEFLKNRVVLPMTGDYAGFDHVLGHELVHAFQFDIASAGVDSIPFRIQMLPLWMVEGMAEYLSVGRDDPHTGMWMRDAILYNNFPTIKQLSTDARFFPYRYGEALFAYVGGTYGDEKVTQFYKSAGRRGAEYAFAKTLGMSADSLSREWEDATRKHYLPLMAGRTAPDSLTGVILSGKTGSGNLNIAPSLSPDGKHVAFLTEKDIFSVALYVADAETGELERKLISSGTNPHFDALRFIDSAGTWSPDGKRFAFSVFASGNNDIVIVDHRGRVKGRVRMKGIGSISNPAWSPDGEWIAFSGDTKGISDLYLVNVETEAVRQLTNDRFSAIQPAWSPDGKTIAYVTDRGPDTDLAEFRYGTQKIAQFDLETSEIELFTPFPHAKHINPQYSPDGNSLYFISDREGFSDIYRADLTTDVIYQVTQVATGVSGITGLSPAISVARDTGRVLYSVYANGNYAIYGLDAEEAQGTRMLPMIPTDRTGRDLPPVEPEEPTTVSQYLEDSRTGLPFDSNYNVGKYRSKISLDYVGTPTAGLAVDRFGASLVGGVSAFFSDMLGNQVIGVGLLANGGIKDIGGQVFYQNRKNRWNWGATLAHIPYLSFYTGVRDTTVTTENGTFDAFIVDQIRERVYVDNARLFTYYPFSTTRRFEVSGGFTLINYERDLISELSVEGIVLSRREGDIPSPPGLNLGQGALAYVHDSSFFGFTSPIRGTRYRLEIGPTVGSLNYYSLLLDYRKYVFTPKATFAFRGLHLARYGKDSENPRLTPFYIGYPTYIRGYSSGSYTLGECTGGLGTDCIEFDRLFGSRFLVSNLEVRIPFIGVEGYGLINFPYLPTELVGFADAGVAWSQVEDPRFDFDRYGTERAPVTSTGAAARFNLLGALILEVYWAYPWQRPFKGGHWGLQLAPGW